MNINDIKIGDQVRHTKSLKFFKVHDLDGRGGQHEISRICSTRLVYARVLIGGKDGAEFGPVKALSPDYLEAIL